MGVFKFGVWLRAKARLTGQRGIFFKMLPKNCSSISFDLNGVIHDARRIVYGQTEDTMESYKGIVNGLRQEIIDKFIAEAVWNILVDTVLTVSPKETVVVAIDGPTNLAKIVQQRRRRYSSASNEHADDPDSSAITPGTPFMVRLDELLRKNMESHRHFFPRNLIYSSHLDPGEGEHKIMSYFRLGKIRGSGAHIVYGLDADLNMLSLLSPQNNIVLMKQDLSELVSIEGIKRMLVKIAPPSLKDHVVRDFVAMMMLNGNDFIPHGHLHTHYTKSNDPRQKAIFNMIESMLTSYFRQGVPLTKRTDSGIYVINFIPFTQITANLASTEVKEVTREATEYFVDKDNYYPSRFYDLAIRDEGNGNVFNWEVFRSAHYNNEFHIPSGIPGISEQFASTSNIEHMCEKYIEGIVWTFRYYQTIHVDNYWNYQYDHAPLMHDLAVYMKSLYQGYGEVLNNKYRVKFEMKHNALDQLLMVVPYSNYNNLPHAVRAFYEDDSDYVDLFPRSVKVEADGLKKNGLLYTVPVIVSPTDHIRVREIASRFDEVFISITKFHTYLIIPREVGDESLYMKLSRSKRDKYDREIRMSKYLEKKITSQLQNSFTKRDDKGKRRDNKGKGKRDYKGKGKEKRDYKGKGKEKRDYKGKGKEKRDYKGKGKGPVQKPSKLPMMPPIGAMSPGGVVPPSLNPNSVPQSNQIQSQTPLPTIQQSNLNTQGYLS